MPMIWVWLLVVVELHQVLDLRQQMHEAAIQEYHKHSAGRGLHLPASSTSAWPLPVTSTRRPGSQRLFKRRRRPLHTCQRTLGGAGVISSSIKVHQQRSRVVQLCLRLAAASIRVQSVSFAMSTCCGCAGTQAFVQICGAGTFMQHRLQPQFPT
eukprot:4170207-Amphidinium_carterae.1